MSIQETVLGANTSSLYWSINTTPTELQLAIKSVLTTHGWEALEAIPHDAGTYIYQGYRALNEDGSYKYIVVKNSTSLLYLQSYEYWDSETHGGTNSSSFSTTTTLATNLTVEGILWISANSKWCMLHQYSNGVYGGGTNYQYGFLGTFELKPVNPGDTGVPFGHTDGECITGGQSSYQFVFNCPRLHDGSVSSAAGQYTNLNSALGSWGVSKSNLLSHFQSKEYPLDLTSYHAYDMSLITQTNDINKKMCRGPIYGLKLFSYGIGSLGNVVTVKCDSEGFIDPNGTDVDHLLFTANQYRFLLPL